MKLGAFSISLAVKDIASSRAFYEKLGFIATGGDQDQRWLIMKNETTIIGLFQGMFEKNMLTFNPGWDSDAKTLQSFDDVREIQRRLKSSDVIPVAEVDETQRGPGHLMVVDPDGNQILIDQHV
jgi:lactoylglutathione lyase